MIYTHDDNGAWFCIIANPQQDAKAKAWLDHRGCEAWFPTERYQRHRPKAKVRYVEAERRVAPGYVFTWFPGTPAWHEVFSSPYIRGALSKGCWPIIIPDAAIAQMQQVPGRIAMLRERERERWTIRKGDKVRVKAGPLADFLFDVTEADGGLIRFLSPFLGGREISVDETQVQKVAAE